MSFLHHFLQRIVIVSKQKFEGAGTIKEITTNLLIVIFGIGQNLNYQIFVHDFTNFEPRARISRLLKHHFLIIKYIS